jgi:hypothetical protein
MQRFKAVLGYFWAGLAIPIIIMTFMQMDFWEKKLILEPGLKVSARWTGGEVVQTIDHQTYRTRLHRLVFDGFLGEQRTGFVQIDWQARQAFPEIIDEKIDVDRDGQPDVQVTLHTLTNQATLTPLNDRVRSLSEDGVLVFERTRSVRVILKNNK